MRNDLFGVWIYHFECFATRRCSKLKRISIKKHGWYTDSSARDINVVDSYLAVN